MTTRVVHSFLSPAYWGSFFALLVNLVLVVYFVYGETDFTKTNEEQRLGELWDYVYVASVILVFVFVARYYSAVAIQTYFKNEGDIFKAPKQLKILLFLLFVTLIFLSGLNTFFIGLPLLITALNVCLVQSILSVVCILLIEIWRWFRPSQVPKINISFFASEIIFGAMVYFLIWMITDIDSTREELSSWKTPIGGLMVWIGILTLHEWLRLYGRKMKEQFVELKHRLTK